MRLLLCLFILVASAAAAAEPTAPAWQRAEISFVDWDILTRARLSPEQLRRGTGSKFTLEGEDLGWLVDCLEVQQLRRAPRSAGSDTRLVVDLFASDGTQATYHADRSRLFDAEEKRAHPISVGFREYVRMLARRHGPKS